MRNILYCLAIRNPYLGYCQGLNFIAYFILLYITDDEIEAFWIFVYMLESILPIDYYTNIKNTNALLKMLDEYIIVTEKDIHKKFKKIGMETTQILGISWFITLFSNNVNTKVQ